MFKFGDLFSGMSCPAFALKQLGVEFSYEFACDIDKLSQRFLKDEHNPKVLYQNVCDIEALPYVDLMVMGFPCQPFSGANSNVPTEMHKSRDLWEQCIRCIRLSRPKVFIMENVKGLTSKSKKSYFDRIIDGLKSLEDYIFEYRVLNSKDFGIPQSRSRIWFIGRIKGTGDITYPNPSPLLYNLTHVIDLSKPLQEIKSKAVNGQPRVERDVGSLMISNLQGTGCYTYYYDWPLEVSYCVLTRMYQGLFKYTDDGWIARMFDESELKQLFGLRCEFRKSYTLREVYKLLGNGMDVHMLEQLIVLNCF